MAVKFLLIDIIRPEDRLEESLGLAMLSAVLKQAGHLTEIMKFYDNHISCEQILSFEPDAIGFTIGTYNIKQVLVICSEIKKLRSEVIICLGGYSANFYAKEILNECAAVDFVILGEGERTITEFANALDGNQPIFGIKGTAYRDTNGSVIFAQQQEPITDLDSLPMPDRRFLVKHRLNIAPIESSRGCLGCCKFCSLQRFWQSDTDGNNICLREKSPERVIEELCLIVKESGVHRVTFVDGSFELSPKYGHDQKLNKIAHGILRNGLDISFYFSTRIDFYKFISPETIQLLIEAGLSGIFLGIESFYQPDLDYFGKGVTVEANIEALDYCSAMPFNTDIGFIAFHPFSTLEGLRTNAKYIEKYGYAARFFMIERLILFKGTVLYDDCHEKGLTIETDVLLPPDYRFFDDRVELLYESIQDYFSSVINKEKNYISLIIDYFNDHIDVIYSIQKYFAKNNKPLEMRMVDEYINVLQKQQMRLGKINTEWFVKLLDLAEAGETDKGAYISVLQTDFPLDLVERIESELKAEKLRFFMGLQKINRNYRFLF